MKKRLLGIAVLLVALAVIVNAMALSSAQVTSAMSIPIVNTSAALIALSAAASQDLDLNVSIVDGQLLLAVEDGVQPYSIYTFDSAFKITNNSDDNVLVTISTSGTPAGVTLTFADGLNDPITSYLLNTATSVNVKLTVDTGAATLATAGISVVVTAARQ